MEFDISLVGIIISFFVSVILSSNFIHTISNGIIDLARTVDIQISVIQLKKKLSANENIKEVDAKSATEGSDFSNFSRSTICNLTLFFWSSTFLCILVLFQTVGFISYKNEDIFSALLYITLLPYCFRFLWFKADKIFENGFYVNIKNNKTATRYPMLFFVALSTFYFVNFIEQNIGKEYIILSFAMGAIAFIVFVTCIVFIYRVIIINKYEYDENNEDEVEARYRTAVLNKKGILAEITTLCLCSIVLGLIIPLVSSYLYRMVFSGDKFSVSAYIVLVCIPLMVLGFNFVNGVIRPSWALARQQC